MSTTTIQIDTAARDRLRVLAAERGATIGGLVAELANSELTRAELAERGARVAAYITANLSPGYDSDGDEARRVDAFLDEVRAGRLPMEL